MTKGAGIGNFTDHRNKLNAGITAFSSPERTEPWNATSLPT